MKVRVDEEKCIGCGLCASLAESVFTLNADGKAEVVAVTPNDADAVEQAAASCPVEAIVVE